MNRLIGEKVCCAAWLAMASFLGIGTQALVEPSAAQGLVSYEDAAPVGLERAWFAQVQVDSSRYEVVGWELYQDNLLCLTSGGLLQSLNAETGETLWTTQVTPPGQKASGPSANEKYVAIVSGATLYVVDRSNGRLLRSRALATAPAAAPALCDTHAYVSFLNGRIEGHNLEDPKASTWYFQSVGRIFHSPAASGKLVTWPTNRGYLYAGQATAPRVLYRIQTESPATAPPTEAFPLMFLAAQDGHVYCFHHGNGNEVWRYSMGFPGAGRPAAVGSRIYATSTEPMLHALDTKTGEQLWTIDGVTAFAAQGVHNVYGLDDLGRVMIFDKEDGHYVGTLPGLRYSAVFNEQTDRLYIYNAKGLVQCLREIGAEEPTHYSLEKTEGQTEEEATPAEETLETTPAAEESVFGEEAFGVEEESQDFETEEPESEEAPESEMDDEEDSVFEF